MNLKDIFRSQPAFIAAFTCYSVYTRMTPDMITRILRHAPMMTRIGYSKPV